MLSSVTSNHETLTFPTDVEGFGYRFDENGELRHIKTNEKFEFEVTPGNQYYNQCHYEALGEKIGEYIEEELVKKYQFKKQIIPIEAIEDETIPKSRIYLSENVADCQILLFLIQGGGVVRSGQWSRKVIINDSLQLGSMFPYIERAKQLNWGIIIFNPNEHFGSYKDGDERKFGKIPGSESHQSHCIYVWENIVRNMTAKHILIVGHSYGGISVNAMLDDCKDFKSRVCAIALTDSVHSYGMIPSSSKKWFKNHTINWIKSSSPTNEPVNNNANQVFGCECRSAGHRKHEYTSGTAIEPIFEYLKDSLHKQKLQQEAKAENKGNEEEKEEDKENLEQKNNLIDDNKMEVEGENDDNKEKGERKEKKVTIKLENNEMEIDGKDTDNSIDNNIDNNGTNDNNNTNYNDNNNNNNTNDSNTNDNNDNNNNNNNNTDEKDTNDIAEKDEKGNIVDNQVVITTTKVVDNGDVTANGDIDNNVNDNINDIVDNNSNVDADINNNNNNRGNDDFNNKSNDNNKDDMEIEEVKVSIDDDNNKVDYNKIEHTNIEDGDIDDVDNNVNVENNKKIDDVDKDVIVENSKKIDDVDKNVVAEKIEDDDSRKIKFQN